MGAWGYKYNQNDEHYNEGSLILKAAITKLAQVMNHYEHGLRADGTGTEGHTDWESISTIGRSYVVTTVNALKGSGITAHTAADIIAIQHAANLVRVSIVHCADNWKDPKEFAATVTTEMEAVDEYLNTFKPGGTLADRIPPLLETTQNKEQ